MSCSAKIACVTGASGMIGSRIVQNLIKSGYSVRALSRKPDYCVPGVEHYLGGIENESILEAFVSGADALFHCAAELYDETRMWDVNFEGTKRLVSLMKKTKIVYFCFLSSAGVIGKTSEKWVDESSSCNPQNIYECSKLAAEQLVGCGISGCRVAILRPTNVIDDTRPGAVELPIGASWLDLLKIILKGGECAHIIHAEDVAHAAVYLISHPNDVPACFFVSCDHEQLNTYAGLWSLYRAVEQGKPIEEIKPAPHLPLVVPYVLRKLWRGKGNYGDVRYSSAKLLATGFHFHLGLEGAVRRIAVSRHTMTS
jgi:nucleoside-diphosphate-sugar epimerase